MSRRRLLDGLDRLAGSVTEEMLSAVVEIVEGAQPEGLSTRQVRLALEQRTGGWYPRARVWKALRMAREQGRVHWRRASLEPTTVGYVAGKWLPGCGNEEPEEPRGVESPAAKQSAVVVKTSTVVVNADTRRAGKVRALLVERSDGLTVSEIARELCVSDTTVRKAIKVAKRAGWVSQTDAATPAGRPRKVYRAEE